ncbi:ABC transporter permease/substrate-binding protein [Oligoflexus tunisiensis]|uniref:ABC transporter permease/substrate-binding protein n=1 Tax=Oligoflexus tunisiensis TaxID=708132 RepID=UPI000A7FA316|nr:ABC transporter permease/substrate-binding protein [Oligoflexus tunisiensis]
MSAALNTQLEFLPANLAGHLLVTVVALTLGILASMPLAVLAVRSMRLRYPILSGISLIQTIPGLALLALTIPILVAINSYLGSEIAVLGFYPAVIALTLYSMLPIVRNSVVGILDVDPTLIEAGRGIGMTRNQILKHVEIPLALPVIIAGIRTATVWTVGTATLATPVGQRCLGNFIFRGLQTRNWTAVLVGCIAAAVLAMVLDGLIAGLQRGVDRRQRPLIISAGAALVALFTLGLLGPNLARSIDRMHTPTQVENSMTPQKGIKIPQETIVIGAKTFSEQYILQDAMSLQLEKAGIPTRRLEGLGSTVAFDALVAGEIDVYVDYSGTIWANAMKETGTAEPWIVLARISAWLAENHGVRNLGALGFENAYALAMRETQARELGIQSIEDLVRHAPRLRIGGDYEFFGRQEWRDLVQVYGLTFADRLTLDSTLMYGAASRGEVDVISAFSSDGRIAAMNLTVLKDNRQAMPPYDALILLSADAAARDDVVAALNPLLGAIPVELMRQANYMVDRDQDKKSVRQAAEWLLENAEL